MTVKSLAKILEKLNPDAELCIEYCPRAHTFITEPILGVRSEADDKQAVILGMGILADGDEIGDVPTIPQ